MVRDVEQEVSDRAMTDVRSHFPIGITENSDGRQTHGSESAASRVINLAARQHDALARRNLHKRPRRQHIQYVIGNKEC